MQTISTVAHPLYWSSGFCHVSENPMYRNGRRFRGRFRRLRALNLTFGIDVS